MELQLAAVSCLPGVRTAGKAAVAHRPQVVSLYNHRRLVQPHFLGRLHRPSLLIHRSVKASQQLELVTGGGSLSSKWNRGQGRDRVLRSGQMCVLACEASAKEQESSTSNTSKASAMAVGSATSLKRLILLRHAKSSWSNPTLRDHDRPLNKRGRFAAGSIARKLSVMGWIPSLILSSDSTRTRQTLLHMGEEVPAFRDAEVRFLGSYYSVSAMDGLTARHLQETVMKYAESCMDTVMCMGHNRGWEEAASDLSGCAVQLKTANAALLLCPSVKPDWKSSFSEGWKLVDVLKPEVFTGEDD